jgi:hypothetical protein
MAVAGTKLYTNEAIAALVPIGDIVTTDFLQLSLATVKPRGVSHAVKGSTLNSKSLADLAIPVIPRGRQSAFVRETRSQLAAVEQTASALNAEAFNLGLIPSALIARAFDERA